MKYSIIVEDNKEALLAIANVEESQIEDEVIILRKRYHPDFFHIYVESRKEDGRLMYLNRSDGRSSYNKTKWG